MNILKITSGVNVQPLLWALQEHPEVWNQHKRRTEHPQSPHHGLSDVWVRYAAPEVDDNLPHESVWYPCASVLPAREIVFPLFKAVNGTRLGGVLITKIPPGEEVKRHTDPGWHAKYYEKFAVQIQSAPGQKFCFDNEELETQPGEVFWFDNSKPHWVTNPTPYERITMIVCLCRDQGD